MYGKHSTNHYSPLAEGIGIKTLCAGSEMLMSEFLLRKDALLPAHAHPYEQTGYLVSGKIRLYIGEQVQVLVPGDSWSVPKDVPHKAEILEDSVAIEVFSPVREDYLKFLSPADVLK